MIPAPTPRARRAAAALALFALVPACRPAAPAAPALVAVGRVWTGDSTRPWAEAVVARGDSIAFVGDSAAALAQAGTGATVLRGAFVAPGLGDAHVHFLDGGFQLVGVDLRDAATPAEFTRRLAAFARTLRPGEWIVGGMWDHENWGGAPLPDRAWIDSVTPDNPVFVSRLDGHMALANSRALAAAGITRASAPIPGGTIVRRADGEPTGLLKDEAMTPVFAVIPDPAPDRADSALVRAMRWAARHGVTTVHAVSAGPVEVAALRRLHDAGRMLVRVHAYPPLATWRAVAETLRARGPGDDWLAVAGVKGFVDGSLGSTTALFERPYDDAPATSGLLVTPRDSLARWIGAADSAGLQVAVHAIGDRANALLLDLYDSVAAAHGPRDRRFRDEHTQHLRPQDVARFGRAGVIASMQPYHAADDGRWAGKRIGPERVRTTYAFRSLLDAGAHLAFGSDWTVAPLDPLLGLEAALTRRTLDGTHPDGWVPEQKIGLEEALRAYTAGVAYAGFAERRTGILRPGMLADLVVLDQDLFRIAPTELHAARVVATVAGGRVTYARVP